MPAIVSDPSLNSGIINQSTSLFDYPDSPAPSILNFQAVPTQPLPDRTATATGLLSPDLLLAHRLVNFPSEIYDLTPSSALMHFLQALMGDSGAGQLRKLQTVARVQSAVTGSNFYDLDSFYGALFGALRGPAGSLPQNPATGTTFNPYTDLASKDGWDDVYSLDATFRERIIALARAIALGGTVPGIQALAEAITGVTCFVFETWALIDGQGDQGGLADQWSVLEAEFPIWNSIPDETWDQFSGNVIYGGLGINARNEIIIQPRRHYDTTSVDGLTQQATDTWGILKVVEVLKPGFALVSVDTLGSQVDMPVPITSLWADSDYWEVSAQVTPASPSDPNYAPAYASYQRGGKLVNPGGPIHQPSAPFCQSQGTQYSYVGEMTSAVGQSSVGGFGNIDDQANYEIINFPAGQTGTFLPASALMDPSKAASARASSSVALQAAPYTGPRVPVQTAG